MIKKITSLLLFVFSISFSFAQVQRMSPVDKTGDSASSTAGGKKVAGESKKEMMKELHLTKEQKEKMKEIKKNGKAKIDAISNDATLNETEKKVRVKTLHAEQYKNTLAVLNEEQKVKMKQMRKQKHKKGNGERETEED